MLRSCDQLSGVRILTARCYPDERGFLLQSYVTSALAAEGITARFCQAIQSTSHRGVLRGLHFQWQPAMGKLIRCVTGCVFDVVVDVRLGSPTFGDHLALQLTGDNHVMVWAPAGFAHGFLVLEEGSTVLYECSAEWNPQGEGGILWNDPQLRIDWPDLPKILSLKDQALPALKSWREDPRSCHFRFGA